MAILFSVHELAKSFSDRTLFKGLSFGVEEKERIGLIGPNGQGKSTLLKIVAQKVEADSGSVAYAKNLRVAYLEQDPLFQENATIMDAMLEKAVALGGDPFDWELQSKAYEFASLINLEGAGLSLETPVSSLSGGWQKRIALVREFVVEPQLLLLDEPTNHLDVEGIIWLEEFLQTANMATVTITHDRVFLQRVSKVILELDRRNPNGLLRVDGDYARYCEIKEGVLASQQKTEDTLRSTLRRESEWLRQGAKARTTKQTARINRAHQLMDDVQEIGERTVNREVNFDFQGSEKTPKKLIEVKKGTKSFDGRVIFKDLDLFIARGSRIGLLGSNGCGKSTLIKSLLGEYELDSGSVVQSENLQVAYFEQNRSILDPKATVMQTLCSDGDHVKFRGNFVHIRSYLDRFLFSTQQATMEVGKLSGGEQARLLIAKLMLQEANLLVLDEPTNDLDLPTLNILEEQLKNFPGAIVLVCHDRYFLDQVCDQILAFPYETDSGHIEEFASVFQWESWFEKERAKAERRVKAPAKSVESQEAKPVKLGYLEQRELDSMGGLIEKFEAQMADINQQMLLPKTQSDPKKLSELSASLGELQKTIDEHYTRWELLEAKAKGS